MHRLYTVDLVIFVCLNFREFLILVLFTEFRICEFSFFFGSTIIIIFFCEILEFVNLSPLAKFAKIKISRILPDLQYMFW